MMTCLCAVMQGFHTCDICMEEKHGAQFVWPARCQHAFCQECIQQLCSLHVAEGSLEQLCCPTPDCRMPFNRQVSTPSKFCLAVRLIKTSQNSSTITGSDCPWALLHVQMEPVKVPQ